MNSAILPIVFSASGKWEFLGTCTLISPRFALTCAHLIEPFLPASLACFAIDSPVAGRRHPRDARFSEALDLGLLEFDPLSGVVPAPLFRARQLKGRSLAAFGYVNEQAGPRPQYVRDVECIQEVLAGGLVQTAQLLGGIPTGFSGGPLQVCEDENRYTAGILQLGGQGITTSQAIAADAIAAFLIEAGWDGVIQHMPPIASAGSTSDRNGSTVSVNIGQITGGVTNIHQHNDFRSKS